MIGLAPLLFGLPGRAERSLLELLYISLIRSFLQLLFLSLYVNTSRLLELY